MSKNGLKTKVDIAVLQEKVEEIGNKVDKILDNHLPHIQAKLDRVDRKNAYFSGGIAVLVVAAELILHFWK